MIRLALLILLSGPALAQSPVYSILLGTTGVTGANYTTASASFSGGTCSSAPIVGTPVIGVSSQLGQIVGLPILYAGSCSVVPNVNITGNGTGATATAALLPYGGTLGVTATSLDPGGSMLSQTGAFIGANYECILTVPAALVTTYKTGASPAVGTSQSSIPMNAAVASGVLTPTNLTLVDTMIADLVSGILTVFDGKITGLPSTTTFPTIQGLVASICGLQQTVVSGWNPSPYNGSFFNLGTLVWTNVNNQ